MEQKFDENLMEAASNIGAFTFTNALEKMTTEELRRIYNELFQHDSVCLKLALNEDGSTEWSDFYCDSENFGSISNDCLYSVLEGNKWIVFDNDTYYTFKNDDDLKAFIINAKLGYLFAEYRNCFRDDDNMKKFLLSVIFRK